MSLSEWGLNNRDAERLRSVLQDDERVVMVAKPRVSMPLSEVVFNTLPGWVLAACALLSFLPTLWVPVVALGQLLARCREKTRDLPQDGRPKPRGGRAC